MSYRETFLGSCLFFLANFLLKTGGKMYPSLVLSPLSSTEKLLWGHLSLPGCCYFGAWSNLTQWRKLTRRSFERGTYHCLIRRLATQQRSNRYSSATLYACQERLHQVLTYTFLLIWDSLQVVKYSLSILQVTLWVQSRNTQPTMSLTLSTDCFIFHGRHMNVRCLMKCQHILKGQSNSMLYQKN